MDRFEGRCWLDWWANSFTLLGSAEIAVVIAAAGGGEAEGHLLSDSDEEREGFAFLCDLDPVFMLRFEDDSTIPVTVGTLEEDGRFALTEYTGPAHRSINHRIDL